MRKTRKPNIERLERRDLLACVSEPVPWYDTNFSGQITPVDVVIVINALNNNHGSSVHNSWKDTSIWVDTNCDGYVTPVDVLMLIDRINTFGTTPQPKPTYECDGKGINIIDISDPETDPMFLTLGSTAELITFSIENTTDSPVFLHDFEADGDGIDALESRIVHRFDSSRLVSAIQAGETVKCALSVKVSDEFTVESERIRLSSLSIESIDGSVHQILDTHIDSTIVFYEPDVQDEINIIDISDRNADPMSIPLGSTVEVITFSIENNTDSAVFLHDFEASAVGIDDSESRIVYRSNPSISVNEIQAGKTVKCALSVKVHNEYLITSERIVLSSLFIQLTDGSIVQILDAYIDSTIVSYWKPITL